MIKKAQYITVPHAKKEPTQERERERTDRFDCTGCKKSIDKAEYEKSYRVCPHCGHNGRLSAQERVKLMADEGSFVETNSNIVSLNPLSFDGYKDKVDKLTKATGLGEAVLTGRMKINGHMCMTGIMDSRFMMASMGSAVGHKLTLLFEEAEESRLPVVVFTTSGGARMHEGILSLMQMAKVSAAAGRHGDAGLLYVNVLCDPTTGGVSASFAMLGDITFAEPGALVGFAGRRVIEGTTGAKLPEDYQSAEFQMKHGFVDAVLKRTELRDNLANVIALCDGDNNRRTLSIKKGGASKNEQQ